MNPRGGLQPDSEQTLDERLAAHGLRATRPRREVYRTLVETEDHPTAEQIHERLRALDRRISLASVYNSLEALRASGLVTVVHPSYGAARYESETRRHHHLICRRCGAIDDLHAPVLDALTVPSQEGTGFVVEDHSVHFYGLCASCAGRATDAARGNVAGRRRAPQSTARPATGGRLGPPSTKSTRSTTERSFHAHRNRREDDDDRRPAKRSRGDEQPDRRAQREPRP